MRVSSCQSSPSACAFSANAKSPRMPRLSPRVSRNKSETEPSCQESAITTGRKRDDVPANLRSNVYKSRLLQRHSPRASARLCRSMRHRPGAVRLNRAGHRGKRERNFFVRAFEIDAPSSEQNAVEAHVRLRPRRSGGCRRSLRPRTSGRRSRRRIVRNPRQPLAHVPIAIPRCAPDSNSAAPANRAEVHHARETGSANAGARAPTLRAENIRAQSRGSSLNVTSSAVSVGPLHNVKS